MVFGSIMANGIQLNGIPLNGILNGISVNGLSMVFGSIMANCRGDWGPLGHGVHWDTPSNRKSPTHRAHEIQFPGCSGTPLVQEH